jgi:hypothetical protein
VHRKPDSPLFTNVLEEKFSEVQIQESA